ncbi:MAG: VWA domain-containing protein [Caldithrix sp.]|nr:VWA domain-containing protein [Caldithrix sp.]
MRNTIFIILCLVLCNSALLANGVAIVNSNDGIYFKMNASDLNVTVENQVAVVTTTQEFENIFQQDTTVKYGFPMPENASATQLQFKIDNQWYEANFAATPQDTSLPGPGGEVDAALEAYLGETPLYFNISQSIGAGAKLTVRLTYVQLLPYAFGDVNFYYPGDYNLLQNDLIDRQTLNFELISERTIDDIQLHNLDANSITNDGHNAAIVYTLYESTASSNYEITYTLSAEELGLFGMSTVLPDSEVPDIYGQGYFTFIAEPDPSEGTETINKFFTLIIDRSGSMSGNKMDQAKEAARFIIDNLNEGDFFNLVDFATNVESFGIEHTEFNTNTRDVALNYIDNLYAGGGTNINDAFETAIDQFSVANDSTANIIIFFTDGQATVGITDTDEIIQSVQQKINETETDIMIFNFGIGSNVNQQLLTRLASENQGFAEFLGDDELEERITQFYLTIRNPVLLDTELSFDPASIVSETYPVTLPNLYKGRQMIVSGRYNEGIPVTVNLSGNAFGNAIQYEYTLNLSDSTVSKNQFLTKLWAKQKIEKLLVDYYSLDPNSLEADGVKSDIIEISLDYGVLSPFTKFSGGDPVGMEERELIASDGHSPQTFQLLGNYPNPFNNSTQIKIKVNTAYNGPVTIKIYNAAGQLVRILAIHVSGPGIYQVHWNGKTLSGRRATSGNYFYIVDFGDGLIGGKMTLMK